MKPIIAISMLLVWLAGMTVLPAQTVAVPAAKSVLILLRQPEGTLSRRLAELPSSTPVPEDVKAAALSEQKWLAQAQQDSFDQRMTAAGATQLVHYPELNMVRADVPSDAMSSLQSDPAVVSVTPMSEDAPVPADASKGVGVPPATGLAAGMPRHRSDLIQSPFISPMPPAGLPALPGMAMPPMQMPGMPLPGVVGLPSTGGMFQSLLGATAQMGVQAETAMPRAAGMAMLVSGTVQIAQIILANRRPGCTLTLATDSARTPESGGHGVIAVNAPPTCLWQARSDADWLSIDTDGPVMGPGIVKYTAAAASAGMLRTGVINIIGIANIKLKGKTSVSVRQGQ
jgi:hypothetical protein